VDVAEYQVEISESNALVELALRVEPEPACSNPEALAAALEKTFQTMLHLRIPVVLVPPGSLPRFELKAQRWIRPRTGPLGSRGERGR
jgi:phenylacetate-CoA ligase